MNNRRTHLPAISLYQRQKQLVRLAFAWGASCRVRPLRVNGATSISISATSVARRVAVFIQHLLG